MSGPRNLLWLLPVLILAISPWWWSLAADFLAPRGTFTTTPDLTQILPKNFVLKDVIFTQSKKGEDELKLYAKTISTKGDESFLEMQDVNALLYGKDNKPIFISSGEAIYESAKRILTLINDVNVENKEAGYEIKTQALRYLIDFRKIKTAMTVELTGTNATIKGTSMFYDLDSGNFRVGGRVFCDTW